MSMRKFRIHGDNVVECERALGYITSSLGSSAEVSGPTGSITCPTWTVSSDFGTFEFTFLPGYGGSRWSQDIIEYVGASGGRLREATDAIISRITGDQEEPLFAFEFCGALPAGNQAWQRQGRAYSFAHAGIPYFYLAELGGYELAADRSQKAERLPNPAIPFSFFVTSNLTGNVCLPVYQANGAASSATVERFAPTFGEPEFLDYVRGRLTGVDPSGASRALEEKCLALVGILASTKRRADGLTAHEWAQLGAAVNDGVPTTKFLKSRAPIRWSKTAYIDALTDSAALLMQAASRLGQGITSSTLPMCFVPASDRSRFSAAVERLYGDVPPSALKWLASTDRDLAIAWVMGFKPRGDDARPDRGLPPLTRMLVGEDVDLLTVMYGPAKSWQWSKLAHDPTGLMRTNGLWEAVLGVSDAVLCDSSTLPPRSPRILPKSHWAKSLQRRSVALNVEPRVLEFSEQDVDTALHTILVGLGPEIAMEGMCNPPGGDWSGISFAWEPGDEHRWLTLPRVSAVGAKRPDHVFAIFGIDEKAVCVCIESKEKGGDLDARIGPRLITYAKELFRSAPSVRRKGTEKWSNHSGDWLPPVGRFASVGAFLAPPFGDPFAKIKPDASLDLALALRFTEDGKRAAVLLKMFTGLGHELADHVAPRFKANELVAAVQVSS